MNLTIATITLLAFVVVAQRIYAGCLKDALVHMDRHCEELECIATDAIDQRDKYAATIAHKDTLIANYLRASDAMTVEMALLEERNTYLEATMQHLNGVRAGSMLAAFALIGRAKMDSKRGMG